MYPRGPSLTTDDVPTSGVLHITVTDVLGSTAETYDDVPIFLQTPGAKAIAGVFAFASILVTCIQVCCFCIFCFCQRGYISDLGVGLFVNTRLCFDSWHGGAKGRALDLRSTGRGFKSYSGQSYVTTLGKLLTPMCLCHQAV